MDAMQDPATRWAVKLIILYMAQGRADRAYRLTVEVAHYMRRAAHYQR